MRKMSSKYNLIEHINSGFRPFRLKCVFVCYINYSKKLSNVFIFPTNGIKAKVRVKATAEEEGKASEIKKFDGTNFGYWRV